MKRLLQEMMIGEGGEVGKRWLKCLAGTGYTQFPDSAPPPKRQFRFHEAGNLDQRPDPAAGVVGDKGHFCIRRFCINAVSRFTDWIVPRLFRHKHRISIDEIFPALVLTSTAMLLDFCYQDKVI